MMIEIILLISFAIGFAPICSVLFAKALGNPKDLVILVQDSFYIYFNLLQRGFLWGRYDD